MSRGGAGRGGVDLQGWSRSGTSVCSCSVAVSCVVLVFLTTRESYTANKMASLETAILSVGLSLAKLSLRIENILASIS